MSQEHASHASLGSLDMTFMRRLTVAGTWQLVRGLVRVDADLSCLFGCCWYGYGRKSVLLVLWPFLDLSDHVPIIGRQQNTILEGILRPVGEHLLHVR